MKGTFVMRSVVVLALAWILSAAPGQAQAPTAPPAAQPPAQAAPAPQPPPAFPEGAKIGIDCKANKVLTDIVTRVERNELKPDPRHITELRLN